MRVLMVNAMTILCYLFIRMILQHMRDKYWEVTIYMVRFPSHVVTSFVFRNHSLMPYPSELYNLTHSLLQQRLYVQDLQALPYNHNNVTV
jgi:hypothetical protein